MHGPLAMIANNNFEAIPAVIMRSGYVFIIVLDTTKMRPCCYIFTIVIGIMVRKFLLLFYFFVNFLLSFVFCDLEQNISTEVMFEEMQF